MKFYLQVTKKLRTFALNLSVCTYAMQNYLFSVDCANHSPRFLFYIAILSTFLTTQRCTSNLNLGFRYQQEGESGLQKRSPKQANYAEKCKIVCKYAKKSVPLPQICVEHNVSRTAVQRWTRLYRNGGYAALRNIRPQGKGRKGMGRPKKKEPQTELERLRYENEYLRAEVALLKKVKALMEEREKRLRETGRKPSKH